MWNATPDSHIKRSHGCAVRTGNESFDTTLKIRTSFPANLLSPSFFFKFNSPKWDGVAKTRRSALPVGKLDIHGMDCCGVILAHNCAGLPCETDRRWPPPSAPPAQPGRWLPAELTDWGLAVEGGVVKTGGNSTDRLLIFCCSNWWGGQRGSALAWCAVGWNSSISCLLWLWLPRRKSSSRPGSAYPSADSPQFSPMIKCSGSVVRDEGKGMGKFRLMPSGCCGTGAATPGTSGGLSSWLNGDSKCSGCTTWLGTGLTTG